MVAVAEAIHVAAREVAAEMTAVARRMAGNFGLPHGIVSTLQLRWTGDDFQLTSVHPGLKEYEYGDGKRPPMAPCRKTMTRLSPLLAEMTDEKLQTSVDLFPEVQY